MSGTTEAFARVRIDALLQDAGWNLTDGSSVLFEHALPDGTQADYVLCDRQGRPVAVLEAKRASIDPVAAQDQGRHYAAQLGVPFVFLSNGDEVRFLERDKDAHARKIAGFFAQDDLERRIAARQARRDLSTVAIDRKIVDRDYQIECIDALSAEVSRGRRKLLVEMATGTGKTRTAAAFIKRLFEAGIVTRVLFLVDRIALARQAEDAFTDHLGDYPCHVLRPGRGFDRAKRVTVATLQTMIAEYRALSPGYFDLVVTDECHRSIYGKWSGVLRHFDGIQLGLTATPCTAEADALPDPEDGLFVRDTLRFFELAEPTYRYTLRRAIEEGHLVPYRIYKAMTVKTAAGNGFEVRRDELDWSAMDEQAKAEFEELFAVSDTITVDPRALERKFTIPERNRALVREFRDAHEKGFMGRDGIRRWPAWGKTIVFAVTRRHAETLAEMFDEHFADLKPHPATRYADFVVSDLGGGPAARCERRRQAFQGRGLSEDTRQREHAGHRLRLPRGGQPRHGAVHAKRHPLPADARAGHAQGAAHRKDRIHDLRLRRCDGLPRRRRRGDRRRLRAGGPLRLPFRRSPHVADARRARPYRPGESRVADARRGPAGSYERRSTKRAPPRSACASRRGGSARHSTPNRPAGRG